ncbi:XrtY-associated glycosyltransferase XYAG1 [Pedobacter sp.]
MKIIQICAAYKPAYVYGGPTMSVAKLAEELTKDGRDVIVLATTANGKSELDVPVDKQQIVDGVKVHYFKRLTKDHTHFSPALLWFLHKEIKRNKRSPQPAQLVVHIHAWWNLVSIFSSLIAKWHHVKVVLSPRGMLTNYTLNNRNSKFKDVLHKLIGKTLLAYSHIHATSQKEQNDVVQTVATRGVTVIPNFVALPQTSFETPHAKTTTYRLLFLSRVEQKKGLEILFEALTKIDFPWQLTIAGSGDENYIEQLKQEASSKNITKNLRWLGHVANEQKFELIAQQDLLVLTSYNENFANVVVESLAMGTPVLVSKEVGLADYVLNNKLGWVTSLDAEDVAAKLTSAYYDVTLRDQIRSNAPLLVRDEFDGNRLTAQYYDMYQSLF